MLPGSPNLIELPMLNEEVACQTELLREFRQGSTDEVVELNRWMSTKDGENGWYADLWVWTIL